MFEWNIEGRRFHTRDARGEDEFHIIEDIQREAWGFDDLDIIPFAHLVAAQWAGGMVLCAFEGERMIGFVYGFPAHEKGRLSVHSHMLAVRRDCRNLQAGYYLKLAQRERALETGVDEITWTFDPLQSLNAHLNFSKLGVISERYIVNFYGEASSSPLHKGFGTDRLWVRWLLDAARVKARVTPSPAPPPPLYPDELIKSATGSPLVKNHEQEPRLGHLDSALSASLCSIEIPHNITAFKQEDPEAAARWRAATRMAFQAALQAGFIVTDILKIDAAPAPRWFYLLSRNAFPS